MYSAPKEKNPNWNGGKTIGSNGYVKILVGVDHPMADSKGYAYEHRIIAEKILGRKLEPGEIVHHKNGIRTDNRPDNLEITSGIEEHFSHHRKRDDLKLFGEPNPMRQCECGCGESFSEFDKTNRPRRYVHGHNARNQKKKGDFCGN